MTNNNVTSTVKQHVLTKSGNCCAVCRVTLYEQEYMAKIAHIYGKEPGSARFDKDIPTEFRNSEANLIVLCANCHDKIDRSPEKYTCKYLVECKRHHENWLKRVKEEAIMGTSFAEIEVLVDYLVNTEKDFIEEYNYDLINFEVKISKNDLAGAKSDIDIGLQKVHEVADYMNRHPNKNCVKILKNRLSEIYNDHKLRHPFPEDIFYGMLNKIINGNNNVNYQVAALGILVYFFEKCDVFEK